MTKEYHKIETVFKRDPENKFRTLIDGQFATDAFEFLANNQWIFTEKVDGTNIRVMIGEGKIRFGGKTDAAQIPAFLVDRLNERFLTQCEALNEQFPDGGTLYGEGYGAKIQKGGGNYRSDQDFVLFDVRVGSWWLERGAIKDIAVQFNLQVVPVISAGNLYDMVRLAKEGIKSRWGDFQAEGIVARPQTELNDRSGHRIITKIKTRDFAAG